VPQAPRDVPWWGFRCVEYLAGLPLRTPGLESASVANLIISGAFGLFRREAVIAANGYAHDTVGEGYGTGPPAAAPMDTRGMDHTR